MSGHSLPGWGPFRPARWAPAAAAPPELAARDAAGRSGAGPGPGRARAEDEMQAVSCLARTQLFFFRSLVLKDARRTGPIYLHLYGEVLHCVL